MDEGASGKLRWKIVCEDDGGVVSEILCPDDFATALFSLAQEIIISGQENYKPGRFAKKNYNVLIREGYLTEENVSNEIGVDKKYLRQALSKNGDGLEPEMAFRFMIIVEEAYQRYREVMEISHLKVDGPDGA